MGKTAAGASSNRLAVGGRRFSWLYSLWRPPNGYRRRPWPARTSCRCWTMKPSGLAAAQRSSQSQSMPVIWHQTVRPIGLFQQSPEVEKRAMLSRFTSQTCRHDVRWWWPLPTRQHAARDCRKERKRVHFPFFFFSFLFSTAVGINEVTRVCGSVNIWTTLALENRYYRNGAESLEWKPRPGGTTLSVICYLIGILETFNLFCFFHCIINFMAMENPPWNTHPPSLSVYYII